MRLVIASALVLLSVATCGQQTGSVTTVGPAGCSTQIAISVHFTTSPGTQQVEIGGYYQGQVVVNPGDTGTVFSLSDPSASDWSTVLLGSAVSLCYPSGLPDLVATPDANGSQKIKGPTKYTIKVIRPSDFTVLAQGDVTVNP